MALLSLRRPRFQAPDLPTLLGRVAVEVGVDVLMSFGDLDYLEAVGGISKKDHIAFEREASQIGAQLRPRTPKRSGKSCKPRALVPQPIDKPACDGTVAAFACDVLENRDEIIDRGIQQDKFTHLVTGFRQFGLLLIQYSG